jgi:dTDP-N-acetylfucosamine:lipid II N-acetylfucosaminyltransferase
MNYHIMVDDKFLDPFIDDMIEADFLKNNQFFIRANIKNRKYVFSEHTVWLSHESLIGMLKKINESDKVYIHGYDFYMGGLCLKFLNPAVELNVILWGGEFFQDPEWYHLFRILEKKTLWKTIKLKVSETSSRATINYIPNFLKLLCAIKTDFGKFKNKKKQVARIDNILVHKYDVPDVALIEEIYENKFRKHIPFFYDYNFDRATNVKKKNNQLDEPFKILVGNSYNHSNNHFDAFSRLKKTLKQPYEIHCPLSYGENSKMRDEIISYGKYLFGNFFYPLTKFMNRTDYLEYLNKMNVVYFNHIRSQAIGNIVTLLSLGKPVFMNKKNTFYQMLNNLEISGVYGTDDFKKFIENKSEFIIAEEKNIVLLEKYFSKTTRFQYLREAFVS